MSTDGVSGPSPSSRPAKEPEKADSGGWENSSIDGSPTPTPSSGTAGSAGSGTAGSGTAGSGTAGSGTAGSGGGSFYGIGPNAESGIEYEKGDAPIIPPEGKVVIDFGNGRYIEVDEDKEISKELFMEILEKLGFSEAELEAFGKRYDVEAADTGGKMPIGEALDEIVRLNPDKTINESSVAAPVPFPKHSAKELGPLAASNDKAGMQRIFEQLPYEIGEEIEDAKEDLRQATLYGDNPVDIINELYKNVRAEAASHGQNDNPVALLAATNGMLEMMKELGPPVAADVLHGVRQGLTEGNIPNGKSWAMARGAAGKIKEHQDIMIAAMMMNGPEMADFYDTGHGKHREMQKHLRNKDYDAYIDKGDFDNVKIKFWHYDHDHDSVIGMMAGRANGGNDDTWKDSTKEVAERYGAKFST